MILWFWIGYWVNLVFLNVCSVVIWLFLKCFIVFLSGVFMDLFCVFLVVLKMLRRFFRRFFWRLWRVCCVIVVMVFCGVGFVRLWWIRCWCMFVVRICVRWIYCCLSWWVRIVWEVNVLILKVFLLSLSLKCVLLFGCMMLRVWCIVRLLSLLVVLRVFLSFSCFGYMCVCVVCCNWN